MDYSSRNCHTGKEDYMSNWQEDRIGKAARVFRARRGARTRRAGRGCESSSCARRDEGCVTFTSNGTSSRRPRPCRFDDTISRASTRPPRATSRRRASTATTTANNSRGHARHQGRVVGVETTPKPRIFPATGSSTAHPTATTPRPTRSPPTWGRAGMMNGTRYAHNYLAFAPSLKRRQRRLARAPPAARRLPRHGLPARRLQPRRHDLSPRMERDRDARTRLLPRRAGQRHLFRRRLERARRLLLHERSRGRSRMVADGLSASPSCRNK
jgi:hypothetical protein